MGTILMLFLMTLWVVLLGALTIFFTLLSDDLFLGRRISTKISNWIDKKWGGKNGS